MESRYKSDGERARQLIANNKYMVVATTDKELKPWAAPVFYVHDKKYNFFFLSAADSRHGENISENRNISIVIFDSSQPIGSYDGVQMEGEATVVMKKDLPDVINMYCNRLFPNSNVPPTERYKPEDYSEPSEFRFFKVEIKNAYIIGVDRRVRVTL